jgi:hypothetical protein
MMGFDDRLLYILLGAFIGFVAGYVTGALRESNKKLTEIKEELDEVDEIVNNEKPPRHQSNERGILSTRIGLNVVVATLVLLTGISAIRAQVAVNNVNETQDRQEALTSCTADIVEQTIETLKIRSDFTLSQVDANVDLQRAQSEMISVLLHEPPYSEQRQIEAFKQYFDALNHFVAAASNAQNTATENPYPTVSQFGNCIDKRLEIKEKN